MRFLIVLLLVVVSGCSVSPVPKNIQARRVEVHNKSETLKNVIHEGDILFRLGNALAGSVDFSDMVAVVSESDFSHAVIVHKIIGSDVIVADVSVLGIERQFLEDWLMEANKNIVVKRLKAQYKQHLPNVLKSLQQVIDDDVLYDDSFEPGADRLYCTELVDYCFRTNGIPLAPMIRMRDLPSFNKKWIIAGFAELLTDLDLDTEVVVAGNDQIGLFSSPYLETVIDLR